jgi:hypothetical protein
MEVAMDLPTTSASNGSWVLAVTPTGRVDQEAVDLAAARALERHILGDRFYLPCGCCLKRKCSFPNAPWFYSMAHYEICAYHQGTKRRRKDGSLPSKLERRLRDSINSHQNCWMTDGGKLVPLGQIRKAVHDCLALKLPYVVMDPWFGSWLKRRALISREGNHVIAYTGQVYDRP